MLKEWNVSRMHSFLSLLGESGKKHKNDKNAVVWGKWILIISKILSKSPNNLIIGLKLVRLTFSQSKLTNFSLKVNQAQNYMKLAFSKKFILYYFNLV